MNEADVKKKYLLVQEDLFQTFASKIHQYGIGMYEGNSEPFRYWAAYFNIRRKSLRLEQMTELAIEGSLVARDKLIDDYKDIANYAIMAVQILEEKDDGV